MKRRKKRKLVRPVPAPIAKVVPTAAGAPPWYKREWVYGLVLVLAVMLTYSPVWWAGFIWDDDDHVTANPAIIGPLGLWEIWTTSMANFFPLTLSTFWLEHALWGLDPLPYHVVTVLFHAASGVVLWRILGLLRIPGAWLGAALWALHPVEVESVAWVSETKNTESGLFYLLAILFFVRWLQANPKAKTERRWTYALTLIFAALAMASKSSTAFLPAVLCLCAWWMEGRWQWRNLVRVLPLFLLSAAGSALSVWTQSQELTAMADPQWVRSWPERVAAAGDAVWFYLGKLIWPYPLSIIYPRWQIDPSQWSAFLPLLAVVLVLFILWQERKSKARPWFFAFAYFLAALLPGLGLIDNSIFRYSLVFDHFQYLASIGPLALAGAGMVRLVDGTIPGGPWRRWAVGAAALALLAGMSWARSWAYENVETLWTDTLAKNPACWAAHNNLGSALSQQGRTDEAMAHFRKALEINPSDAEAECNLGGGYFQKGDLETALVHFRRAVELKPSYAEAQNNVGCVLLRKGQAAEAVPYFEKALELDPELATAQSNLALAQGMVRQAQRP